MKFIIIIALAIFIFIKIKNGKAEKELEKRKAEERAGIYAERKKTGNPSVSERIPGAAEAGAEMDGTGTITGADGKEYPNFSPSFNHVAIHNLSDSSFDEEKYEYSPVYVMLAVEYYLRKFEERICTANVLNETDVDNAFKGIYELAENYYYPRADNNDLTHFIHYEVRYKKDWLRAMNGNGYYQNVYHIPIDASRALEWYELADTWFAKYGEKVIGKGECTAIRMMRSKLQAAHILSAGLYGIAKDTQKALGLYGQVFQVASHYSQEDMQAEVICAMIQGYPRNPEDYVTSAVNMLADWACRSDLGLAMLIEYTRYASRLDKKTLAQSPEAVVKLGSSMAEENVYAGYLLGMAMLSGYGIKKNQDGGMKMLDAAAAAGSVFAAYVLWQLAADDKEKQAARKEALDRQVEAVCSANGSLRALLEAEGKNLTAVQKVKIKEQVDKTEKQAYEEALRSIEQEQEQGFSFPAVIYDAELNRWELGETLLGVATYWCMNTGEKRELDRLDIERLERTPGIRFE